MTRFEDLPSDLVELRKRLRRRVRNALAAARYHQEQAKDEQLRAAAAARDLRAFDRLLDSLSISPPVQPEDPAP